MAAAQPQGPGPEPPGLEGELDLDERDAPGAGVSALGSQGRNRIGQTATIAFAVIALGALVYWLVRAFF